MGGIEWRTGDSNVSGANRIAASISAIGDGTFNAADKAPTALTFATHGTSGVSPVERMRINSSGRVGIGTTSPEVLTHLKSSDNTIFEIESTTATAYMKMVDSNTTGAGYIGYVTNDMTFWANNAERMRINSSGQVSVFAESTVSPNMEINRTALSSGDGVLLNLECNNNSGTGNILRFTNDDPTINSGNHVGEIQFFSDDAGAPNSGIVAAFQVVSENASGDSAFTWRTGGTERMRLSSSGHLIVAKTSTSFNNVGITAYNNGQFQSTVSSNECTAFQRLVSQGDISQYYYAGTYVGSIAVISNLLAINATGAYNTGALAIGGSIYFQWDSNQFYPLLDNARDLGTSSYSWDDVYATNGTIQTSDANEKQDIEPLSEAEQRVAVAAKGLLRKFRWKSAVEEKDDDARIHFGIIAQDLQAAFEAEGLDAGRYAMFIHSTWTDEETGEERSRMGVRYSELLAFIIAAI